MRSTLLATIAAAGLALATPALADTGSAPNIPPSAASHAVTVQAGPRYLLTGGEYFGDENQEYRQQPQRVADAAVQSGARYQLTGGDYFGDENQEYQQQRTQRVADGGDYPGSFQNYQPQRAA